MTPNFPGFSEVRWHLTSWIPRPDSWGPAVSLWFCCLTLDQLDDFRLIDYIHLCLIYRLMMIVSINIYKSYHDHDSFQNYYDSCYFFEIIRASGAVQDAVHLPVLRSESQWPFGGGRGGDNDRTHPAVAWWILQQCNGEILSGATDRIIVASGCVGWMEYDGMV